MIDQQKIRSGFIVAGPNIGDHQPSNWYFTTLEVAKSFAERMAKLVDAEYDILQYVGTMRQAPAPTRPIEWIEPKPQ